MHPGDGKLGQDCPGGQAELTQPTAQGQKAFGQNLCLVGQDAEWGLKNRVETDWSVAPAPQA